VTGEAQQAAYVAALHAVFTVAFPCALAGLLLAFRLEEVPLRETATAPVPESAITPTMDTRSAEEIERILGRLIDREERQGVYERLAARAGVALPPIGCWLLFRLDEFSPSAVSTLARHLPIPHTELLVRLHWLDELGLISLSAGTAPTDPVVTLTGAGQEAVSKLARARRERLESLARGWHPERYPELEDLLRRLARVMVPDLGTGSTPGRR
jgi:DNA-binding MarR family transcriptional regulator